MKKGAIETLKERIKDFMQRDEICQEVLSMLREAKYRGFEVEIRVLDDTAAGTVTASRRTYQEKFATPREKPCQQEPEPVVSETAVYDSRITIKDIAFLKELNVSAFGK